MKKKKKKKKKKSRRRRRRRNAAEFVLFHFSSFLGADSSTLCRCSAILCGSN